MNYSHRFWLYGPVSLFAILMLGVVAYWFVASHEVSRKLEALNGHEIAPGITMGFAHKTMAGFPFRVDGELDGFRVTLATSHGPAVWTAEKFAFHSLTYGRTQYVFEAAGQQTLTWHKDDGSQRRYRFLPGLLRASMIAGHGELSRFDLEAIDVDSPELSATQFQAHLRKNPRIDALDFNVTANGVRIADDLKPAFGPDLKLFHAEGLISPGTSFDRLLEGKGDWRAAAEDWRKRDGGVLVKAVALNWGNLDIAGKGALTADALHRPKGALEMKIANWQPLLKAAQERGWIKGSNGGLAAGFLAFADAAPSGGSLNATLGFQDGIFSVGSIPADTLAPLY
ncbi:MAG: DUF2125 domain-containing protein [Proteobacteria bacterium]|nr:DUF2125 domain-containing protein [Pseudomonadota bacterium]